MSFLRGAPSPKLKEVAVRSIHGEQLCVYTEALNIINRNIFAICASTAKEPLRPIISRPRTFPNKRHRIRLRVIEYHLP